MEIAAATNMRKPGNASPHSSSFHEAPAPEADNRTSKHEETYNKQDQHRSTAVRLPVARWRSERPQTSARLGCGTYAPSLQKAPLLFQGAKQAVMAAGNI